MIETKTKTIEINTMTCDLCGDTIWDGEKRLRSTRPYTWDEAKKLATVTTHIPGLLSPTDEEIHVCTDCASKLKALFERIRKSETDVRLLNVDSVETEYKAYSDSTDICYDINGHTSHPHVGIYHGAPVADWEHFAIVF